MCDLILSFYLGLVVLLLIAILIYLYGDIVFDGFLGSGTTAVACVNTNRHYIGFELDPQYYDIACKRLEEAYGVVNKYYDVKWTSND